MIKAKEIASLKTTGEEVFVLSIDEATDAATVRRATFNPNLGPFGGGLAHLTETFTLSELETIEERRARELESKMALHQKIAAEMGTGVTFPTDQSFSA